MTHNDPLRSARRLCDRVDVDQLHRAGPHQAVVGALQLHLEVVRRGHPGRGNALPRLDPRQGGHGGPVGGGGSVGLGRRRAHVGLLRLGPDRWGRRRRLGGINLEIPVLLFGEERADGPHWALGDDLALRLRLDQRGLLEPAPGRRRGTGMVCGKGKKNCSGGGQNLVCT